MKKKSIVKMIVDILMLMLMLLEYSKVYTGQLLHEVFGILLFILFIVHNILNISFYKALMSGKYTLRRAITTIVNIGFLVCMLLTIVLGIPISSEIFKWINLSGNMTTRKLHVLIGYWDLIFLSIHLGFHFNMIYAKIKGKVEKNKAMKMAVYVLEFVVIALGIKFCVDTKLLEHLIGRLSFGVSESNIFFSLFRNFVIVFSISHIVYNLDKILIKKSKK